MAGRRTSTQEMMALFVWMGGPILWVSKKHQHVGESSAEDEYMALNLTIAWATLAAGLLRSS